MMNKDGENKSSSSKDFIELEKGKEHIIVEIVEYVPNAVVSRTIIKKSSGNVTAMSFSEGEELSEKIIPFDNFIQVIDGEAELSIGERKYHLGVGMGITIPAHTIQRFYANQKFKIISTVIKSGYED